MDLQSSQGATALMFAADAGDEEVCDLLLRAGADPSASWLGVHLTEGESERDGRTVFQIKSWDFLIGILSCSSYKAKDADGDNAAAWAKARGHQMQCFLAG